MRVKPGYALCLLCSYLVMLVLYQCAVKEVIVGEAGPGVITLCLSADVSAGDYTIKEWLQVKRMVRESFWLSVLAAGIIAVG